MKVRTRFAPSPTGYVHVGGIRTALFAWLLARQAGGQFILRLEDTDRKREVEGTGKHIETSLKTLGLNYDEGPDIGGPFAPYRQSQRLKSYEEWARKLIDSGRAYADPYTPEELEQFRQKAKDEKKPFLFRDHRPQNPPAWDGSRPLRFRSDPKAYAWKDEVMGELKTGPEVIDDFILIKSDGFPTYNFAHIIDDAEMEISHVIRGQEFLASVPNYLNLYEALEIDRPLLATVPHILAPAGNKKLSKRDGAKDILDYVKDGFLPEALVSFIATMGWNDGTQQEIYSVQELIEKFSLERVQRSGARFDEKRLGWVNGHFIRELPPDELYKRAEGFWPPEADGADESHKKAALALVQERLKYLGELSQLTKFFFATPADGDIRALFENPVDKQLKNLDRAAIIELLKKARDELSESDFSEADLAERLNGLLEKLNTKPGILFAAIRIAVTGAPASPQLFGTLHALGKEESLSRLNKVPVLLKT